jgi:hypothetical protein
LQSDEFSLYLTFRFQDKEKKRASVGSAVGGGSGRRRGGGSDSAAAVLDLKRANMIGIVMSRFKLSSSAAAGGASTGQMRDVAAALREDDGSENGISLEDAQARVSFASEWFGVSFDSALRLLFLSYPRRRRVQASKTPQTKVKSHLNATRSNVALS